ELVLRRRKRLRRGRLGWPRRWFRDRLDQVDAGGLRHQLLLEIGEGLVEFLALLQRLAVPVVLAFGYGDALPLHRPGDDHRRLPLRSARFREGVENLVDVVSVDRDGVPAERAPAARELLEIVPPHGGAAL